MKIKPKIIGVIIAGGESSRMGVPDKCLLELNNQPIITKIIERLKPQTDKIIISINGDVSRFDFTGLPIIKDLIADKQGPLAGIYSAMLWVKANISKDAMIACVPSDSPFIPLNFVEKLKNTYDNEKTDIIYAMSNEQRHPIFSLMPVSLHEDLYKTLTTTKTRAIYKWFQNHNITTVEFQKNNGIDPFFNINTPKDLKKALDLTAIK